MAYGRFIAGEPSTQQTSQAALARKGKKPPMWVITRMKQIEENEKAIAKMREWLYCTDHSIPWTEPVGEFRWHEARKGK